MKIIFQISGGIGKSVAATAVCKAIKKQHPKDELIVITGYPEVFLQHPDVDEVLGFGNLHYFYPHYIENKDSRLLLHDPYHETDFVYQRGHLIKVWCDMFGIAYNGEQPELYLTGKEKTVYGQMFASPKPVLVIQTNGGVPNQADKYAWPRDLPLGTAQKVVDALAGEYNIAHIRRKDQPELKNTFTANADFRALAVLIAMSEKRLLIDSFAQHAAAALGKPSVVCWVANAPSQFGYELHTNIVANPPKKKPEMRNAVFSKYNIAEQITEFPYNSEEEIFDAEKIIAALRKDPYEGKAPEVQSKGVSEKIQAENGRHSMVAKRLACLNGKADLGNVKRILDIGSWHLGQSIEFANVFREAQIDAFEPVPASYQLCMNNLGGLEQQRRNRIRVHNMALSNAAGDVPFYVVDKGVAQGIDEGFSSMFRFNGEVKNVKPGAKPLQREIKVQANTLDNWCKENKVSAVDIMWMDAQGSELLVLQGAKNILKNTRIIMTEVGLKPYYEGHTMKADIDKFLSGLGFSELEGSFELNGFDYEANTIYVRQMN